MTLKGRLRKFFTCSLTAPRRICSVPFPCFKAFHFLLLLQTAIFSRADISLPLLSSLFSPSEPMHFQVQFESRIRDVFRARLDQAHDTGNTLTFLDGRRQTLRCFVRGTVDTAVGAEWRWQAEEGEVRWSSREALRSTKRRGRRNGGSGIDRVHGGGEVSSESCEESGLGRGDGALRPGRQARTRCEEE